MHSFAASLQFVNPWHRLLKILGRLTRFWKILFSPRCCDVTQITRAYKDPRRYLLRSLIMRFWNSDEMALLKLGLESSLSVCLSGGCLSVWWLGCLWRCGLRRAMLMSFRSRGNGPSLMIASFGTNNRQKTGDQPDDRSQTQVDNHYLHLDYQTASTLLSCAMTSHRRLCRIESSLPKSM